MIPLMKNLLSLNLYSFGSSNIYLHNSEHTGSIPDGYSSKEIDLG